MRDSDSLRRAQKAAVYLERASLELETFADAFAGAADILGGRSFHMTRIHANGEQDFYGGAETHTVLNTYFGEGWHEIDTWSRNAQTGTRGGRLVRDATLIPHHVRERDRFFQEFCRDWDLGHYAAWTFDLEGQTWGYTLIRPHGHDFDDGDMAGLELLRSAASRAALLACSFRDARIHGVADGLERSGRPSVILDQDGRVIFATTGAQQLAGSAFTVRQGRIAGLDNATEAHLRRLRAAIREREARLPAFPISAPLRARPVIAVPMRLYDDHVATLPGAHVLLMLIDPAVHPVGDHDILRSAFGLSPREADLALLLGQGATLAQAADQLGLKLSSVRQLAKAVLARTASTRQSELVALVQRLTVRTSPGRTDDRR